MWTGLLDRAMRPMIRTGRVQVTLPDGTQLAWGDAESGPDVALRIHDAATLRALALDPDLALGEAYADGRLTIEGDDLPGLMELVFANGYAMRTFGLRRFVQGLRQVLRWAAQYNPAARSRQNVAHHYDLSGSLYDLFLDADRQYSCAYFTEPGQSLDAAQAAKKRHIARKLLIEPGMRVLDIGSGWGGLGLTLAREFGADVTGVTLSTEQHALSNRRARDAGLAEQARFELQDYRAITERFDRIVSVGMFEHVGVPHYREYFRTIRERLAPGGVALVHTIGRSSPPGSTNAWLAKYIFPGGYCPALSEVAAAIEQEGLVIADLEVWRLHYAETLRHWRQRFEANMDAARALYDERFCRMWRFYLVACEMSFRQGTQVVFQFQLSLRNDTVPITRDYLHAPAEMPQTAGRRRRQHA